MIIIRKKAQIIGEVLKYGLVIVFAAIVVGIGYKSVNSIKESACKSEIAKFELELSNIGKSIRQGEKELRNYKFPCSADKIYLFDLSKNINPDLFNRSPIIKDSLITGTSNNVFLVKDEKVISLFYAGDMEIDEPYYICFNGVDGSINFFVEGLSASAKIAIAPEQKLCS